MLYGTLWLFDGLPLVLGVGLLDGLALGDAEGDSLGELDGLVLGEVEGEALGDRDGLSDGDPLGEADVHDGVDRPAALGQCGFQPEQRFLHVWQWQKSPQRPF